jgi:signal transduction histidine kinase
MMRSSVFGKLLTIMLTMAVSLLLLVLAFFTWVINPAISTSVEAMAEEYVQTFARTSPGLDEGRRLAEQLNMHVRYEGPRGDWTTSESMPPIDPDSSTHWRQFGGRGYYLAPAPGGGHYLFRWSYRRQLILLHHWLLMLLLATMVTIVIITYAVLRGLLRPLRTLGEGVARLSDGELDVVVPNRTRDEFGALTQAFNEMVRRVGAMIRARDQLLLDVSHELRSPLTRLRVALELLPESPDRARIQREVVEMDAMIAELLELERLRDGRALRLAEHDLAALVTEVASRFDGVEVTAAAPSILRFDAEKMRTVVTNLLENAVKYSLPDSRPVQAAIRGNTIVVEDDGPGIPEADLPNIFDPFFRVNRSRAKTPDGYGLGLSICKRIVEAHGGTITAANRHPRGTTFTVTLPR